MYFSSTHNAPVKQPPSSTTAPSAVKQEMKLKNSSSTVQMPPISIKAIPQKTFANKRKSDCITKRDATVSSLNSYIEIDTKKVNDFNTQITTLQTNAQQAQAAYDAKLRAFQTYWNNLEQQQSNEMSSDASSNNSDPYGDTQKVQNLQNQIDSLMTQYRNAGAGLMDGEQNGDVMRQQAVLLSQMQGLQAEQTSYRKNLSLRFDYNQQIFKQKWGTKVQALENQKRMDASDIEMVRTDSNNKIASYTAQISDIQNKLGLLQKEIDDNKAKLTKASTSCEK